MLLAQCYARTFCEHRHHITAGRTTLSCVRLCQNCLREEEPTTHTLRTAIELTVSNAITTVPLLCHECMLVGVRLYRTCAGTRVVPCKVHSSPLVDDIFVNNPLMFTCA